MFYTSNTFVSYNHPLKEADVVFLGIPFAGTSVSKPAIYGPLMVRESMKLMEDFVDSVNLFEKLKVCDLGDLEIVPGSYELTADRIRQTIADIRNENKKSFLIFIGGEHLITLPIIEATKPRTIIHLDAHSDSRSEYLGNKFMHQTWAHHAGKIADIIQLGITTWNKEEKENLGKNNINFYAAEDFITKPPKMQHPVHLTIDIDVLQGVETGLPEGRMDMDTLMKILDKTDCNSMDIAEIGDDRLPSKTGFMAAHIIKKVLSKLL
ncbi:MAG: arginase family protein [Candidatus Aenigmarchaeota archaeon]|nr:arginase family protein [Candidatus Aenigmarchaeota archaeon]